MRRLLLILVLAAFMGGTAMPMLSSFLGFWPATAYAKNGPSVVSDDQGEDNDDQ